MELKIFPKKVSETWDYDFDFSDLEKIEDSIQSYVVVIPDGITKVHSSKIGEVIKVWISGGLTKKAYKVSVVAHTEGGRVIELSCILRVT